MSAGPVQPVGDRTGESVVQRPQPQISLVDLLDRLLGSGVVLAGDVVISLAGVDLVQVKLHAMISSVRADMADPRQAVRGGSGG